MNPPENAPPSRPMSWDKLPPGLRRLLETLPEREWPRIRAFHIQTDEEAELAGTLPLARRAIELCPPKMIARIRAKEITGAQVDEAYRKLHDSIHAVREALLQLFEIAGVPFDSTGRRPYTRKISAPAEARPTGPA